MACSPLPLAHEADHLGIGDTLDPRASAMAPRGALFQHLADLEQAASRERQRMVEALRDGAARQTPRRILELVDRVSPGCLVLLPSALKAAEDASGFEYGEKLFDCVWKLATKYRQLRTGPGRCADR